jgi:hypothetical protein
MVVKIIYDIEYGIYGNKWSYFFIIVIDECFFDFFYFF